VKFEDFLADEGQNGHVKKETTKFNDFCTTENHPTEDEKLLVVCKNHKTDDENILQSNTSLSDHHVPRNTVLSQQSSVSDTDNIILGKDDEETGSLLREVEDCLKEQRLSGMEEGRNSLVSEM